jgi:hypothetical protein
LRVENERVCGFENFVLKVKNREINTLPLVRKREEAFGARVGDRRGRLPRACPQPLPSTLPLCPSVCLIEGRREACPYGRGM